MKNKKAKNLISFIEQNSTSINYEHQDTGNYASVILRSDNLNFTENQINLILNYCKENKLSYFISFIYKGIVVL